jgi:glycosyltransferase involved in cell wall biosynthesis
MKKFILLEPCNFTDYPTGGGLSFSKMLLKVYGSDLAIVGVSTDPNDPVGAWIKKTINGIKYDFFATHYIKVQSKKPFVPARLISLFYFRKYLKNIFSYNCNHVFTGCPQYALIMKRFNKKSYCYCFAGTANSVGNSRYHFFRSIGKLYEKKLFKSLAENFDVLLAAADNRDISKLLMRSQGAFTNCQIRQFPTRVDKNVFHPVDIVTARKNLNLNNDDIVFVAPGRLSWVKGWDFLLQAFKIFQTEHGHARLFMVGGGEDENKIRDVLAANFEDQSVVLCGIVDQMTLNYWLNAADSILFCSHFEGWPTSMVEALACSKPLVSTDVGGANDMIIDNKNGFVCKERDPAVFAELMGKSLKLKDCKTFSLKLSEQYSINTLDEDLKKYWPAIS